MNLKAVLEGMLFIVGDEGTTLKEMAKVLEVSEENKSAINLYKKCGFNKAAIRKNYYKNSNGILMMKSGD